MPTIELPEVLVLGRDSVGVIAESEGFRYYLTECCGASAKGCDGYIGCRACYREVDPMLGDVPDKAMRSVDGRWEFVDRPIAFVEVYGDGLPYDQWKASRS